MKKIYFPLILVLFMQVVVFGQEVPQEQKVVITKIAATWCPPCGGTAWDHFEVINETYADKAVILTAHPSRTSDLHAPESIDFTGNLPQAFGQPLFYINQIKHTTGTILQNLETAVKDSETISPLANTGIIATIKDNQIEVDAKVKFFEAGTGDFFLSLLVIEDGVVEFQFDRGDNAVHKRVLRSALGESTFGENILNGTVSANAEFDIALTKEIDPAWIAEHIEIAAILWNKVGNNYEFVNANVVPVSFSTSINILEASGLKLAVTPTLIQQSATINIDTPKAFDKVNIGLFNTTGQQVQTVFSGALNTGLHHFFIDKSNLGASGIYFLQMESEGSVISRKLVVE